jgi:hypothetical protein
MVVGRSEHIDHMVTAAIFSVVAALIPAHWVLQGVTKVYADPPPVDAPAIVEQHVVEDAVRTHCGRRRFGGANRCLIIKTRTGKTLEIRALTVEEDRQLSDFGDLRGKPVSVGFWGAERPKVVSVTSGDRTVVGYEARRDAIRERGRLELLFGAGALFVIFVLFLRRCINVTAGSVKEAA